jgi:transposase
MFDPARHDKGILLYFLHFFSEQVRELWGDAPILMIADGAGAHQREVCLQVGIELERLPAASPELNPVEQFFQELRKHLSNQVYADINQAEEHLQQVLQPYFNDKDRIIQLTHYSYIRTQ